MATTNLSGLLPEPVSQVLRKGAVIPAHPLALNAQRQLDPRRQRALSRYYLDAGAGGLAVGVHTTQFAIRENGMYAPVLEMAMQTAQDWIPLGGQRPLVMIAGVAGPTSQACAEAATAKAMGYHAGLLSLAALRGASEAEILAHCRSTGTWVLADEVYERLYYETDTANGCAPSFLDVAEPQDRLVVAHSFSKSFLMTGWRLGWLVMPPDMIEAMGKLIEFNTSCCSVFTQRAGLAALQRRQDITPRVVAHLKACRDTLVGGLQTLPGLELSLPLGGMYAFFRLPGHDDGLATAKRLVTEAGLGLAPGEAFGPEAAGWLRWCFASQDPQRLRLGVERLRDWVRL